MGWADAFRRVHGQRETHTWYSPNAGNGYRLDQAFVNRALLPTLTRFRYAWGSHRDAPRRRDALSDHAAMIIDLALPRGLEQDVPAREQPEFLDRASVRDSRSLAPAGSALRAGATALRCRISPASRSTHSTVE